MNAPPDVPEESGTITVILVAAFILAVVSAILTASIVASPDTRHLITLWLSAAGALGLLSGYTTGASDENGTASEFLKFLSGGLLVPLFGGVAGLVSGSEKVTESYRYVDGQLVEKVTDTQGALQTIASHPMAVLGGFIVFYSVFAAAGIVLGIHHRSKGVKIEMTV